MLAKTIEMGDYNSCRTIYCIHMILNFIPAVFFDTFRYAENTPSSIVEAKQIVFCIYNAYTQINNTEFLSR